MEWCHITPNLTNNKENLSKYFFFYTTVEDDYKYNILQDQQF